MLLNLSQDFDQDPEVSKCCRGPAEPLFCSGGRIHRQALRLARRLDPRFSNTKGVLHALFENGDSFRNANLDPFVFFRPEVSDHPVHLFVCVGLGYDRFHLIFTPNTELDPVNHTKDAGKSQSEGTLLKNNERIQEGLFRPEIRFSTNCFVS